jgi:hypothetical protein
LWPIEQRDHFADDVSDVPLLRLALTPPAFRSDLQKREFQFSGNRRQGCAAVLNGLNF